MAYQHITELNLRQVEIFRAVMKFGTVTAAAAALGSSQPTISRELHRLEDVVGFALFERRRQRLQPTARAQKLYHEVQSAFIGLERINTCVNSLREIQDEVLYVSTLPAFAHSILPEAIARLSRTNPGVSVHVDTTDPRDQSPISGFNFDIGLTEAGIFVPGTETIALGVFEQVAVLAEDDALAAPEVLTPEDLAGVRFISLGKYDPYRLLIDRAFDAAKVQRRMLISSQSSHAACEMVRRGLGVTIVNPLTALSFRGRGVVLRRFRPALPFPVSALCPVNRPFVAAGESLVRHLRTVCLEARQQIDELLG
ncbi:LysR family transcriptional regulator [Acidimangrovimonas sediminis]|uniref:LysR family transcriptional regulator n=1 Tax=Acidimangrovimonas sediminis TaxID=2056283 RepID=UPI000C806C12|nr:LysR family transcriptional regulator [Acidimangrovimonas sediminis]